MFKTFSCFTTRCAAALIAAPLVLGTVSVTALVTAAPASAMEVLGTHGIWWGFSTPADGATLFGAMAKMSKGGTVSVVTKGDTFSLVMTDPNWDLKPNRRVPVRVQVDGATFAGTGIVTSRDMVEIPALSSIAFKGFAESAKAVVDVNDGEISWTLVLDGFTASMSDAVKRYKISY